MRLRKVKNASEILNNHSDSMIFNPEDYQGKWKEEVFKNENPLHIEIGSGKGKFIIEMAQKFPNINFVAIEKYDSVLCRAIVKVEEKIPNLYFILYDATNLKNIFGAREVDKIYLNFSDPWPKSRHENRRLTSPNFLDIYYEILANEGELIFKTDNLNLFNYSVESFQNNGYFISDITYDLESLNAFNVRTEYEEKHIEQGEKICRLIAIK